MRKVSKWEGGRKVNSGVLLGVVAHLKRSVLQVVLKGSTAARGGCALLLNITRGQVQLRAGLVVLQQAREHLHRRWSDGLFHNDDKTRSPSLRSNASHRK